jgi:hypothetical protein
MSSFGGKKQSNIDEKTSLELFFLRLDGPFYKFAPPFFFIGGKINCCS